MGELWQTSAIIPAQEHFASNILREKIITLTSALPKPKKEAKKILFFLPENEYHELSILYSTYVARSLGFNTIYLGQSVPINDVLAIGALHKVDFLLTSITKSIVELEFKGIFSKLTEKFPTSIIIATGQQVEQNSKWVPKSIYSISKPSEFKELLKKVGV
jgi:methanogenic corrinoid protein MtbC1